MVGAIILGLLYGYTATASMEIVQKLHDYRIQPLGVASPQTSEQRDQVSRILSSDEGQHYIHQFQRFHQTKDEETKDDDSVESVLLDEKEKSDVAAAVGDETLFLLSQTPPRVKFLFDE